MRVRERHFGEEGITQVNYTLNDERREREKREEREGRHGPLELKAIENDARHEYKGEHVTECSVILQVYNVHF